MAIPTINLDPPVLQDLETWSSTQNHDLGYSTRDRSTGKRYQYKCLGAAVTGLGVISSGTVGGPYIPDANATYTAHYVSADASLAGHNATCVFRGSATAANKYGFVEVIELGAVTTVNVSWVAVAPGNTLLWAGDGYLETISVFNASVCAIAVDSHRTSYSQNSVLLTTAQSVTPITVKWL